MPTNREIDDAVATWHKADTYLSLFEWLGWTWQEYAAWVENPENIPDRPLMEREDHAPDTRA